MIILRRTKSCTALAIVVIAIVAVVAVNDAVQDYCCYFMSWLLMQQTGTLFAAGAILLLQFIEVEQLSSQRPDFAASLRSETSLFDLLSNKTLFSVVFTCMHHSFHSCPLIFPETNWSQHFPDGFQFRHPICPCRPLLYCHSFSSTNAKPISVHMQGLFFEIYGAIFLIFGRSPVQEDRNS